MELLKTLKFPLDVKDEWPPVGVEDVGFVVVGDLYRAAVPPLFIKDLSVDDMIRVNLVDEDFVDSWEHVSRSSRTTVWLGRLTEENLSENVLSTLRGLGCTTSEAPAIGCYSVDVPEELAIDALDSVLEQLDPETVAVAFPAFRHS